jgi:hypothetical protein
MAAGKKTYNVTYATGTTLPKEFWADDSTTPTLLHDIEVINDSAGNEILGLTTGAAVVTDANGTIQQYLRGLVKLVAAKIGIVIADGDNATQGVTTGAAVVTDANGTLQQFLRGLVKLWASVTFTSSNLNVNIAAMSGANANQAAAYATSVGVAPVGLPNDQVWASAAHSFALTFTPGASSHTAGVCVGAAGAFTTMGQVSKRAMITSASILIESATAVASGWRLYLYNVTPPSAVADGSAWDLPSGDWASFLGYVDIGSTSTDQGSAQYIEVNNIGKQILLAATPSIFAYLVNTTTATLAAVSHIVTLHTVEV